MTKGNSTNRFADLWDGTISKGATLMKSFMIKWWKFTNPLLKVFYSFRRKTGMYLKPGYKKLWNPRQASDGDIMTVFVNHIIRSFQRLDHRTIGTPVRKGRVPDSGFGFWDGRNFRGQDI